MAYLSEECQEIRLAFALENPYILANKNCSTIPII